MAFQQGLSGLNMASKGLDVVGNNIANSQTVGFKSAVTQFNDVYASAVMGSAANAVGQGGAVMDVAQQFTQGNVTVTNNPLDIAISGQGFLHFQPTLTDATPEYSRNGQMHANKEGYLVNALDQFLCCYPSTDGKTIDSTQAKPMKLPLDQLKPQQTGWSDVTDPGSGGVFIGANLDIRDQRALGATAPGWTAITAPAVNFVGASPAMYNYSTSSSVYDQAGQPHVMTMYFVRQGDSATGATQRDWAPHFVLDNKYEITGTDATTGTNLLSFDPNGQMSAASAKKFTLDLVNAVDSAGNPAGLTDPAGLALFDAAVPMNFDFSKMTEFGSSYDVSSLTQDGYGPGMLSGVSIDKGGNVQGRYSNGQSKLIGQIPLTNFQNPNGLIPLGNNMWASSSASGQPLEGSPETGSRGAIQAGAVEEANVDLTAELVNMITMQRAYQANAQTIKTQDSILQTLVNLR
jgi:flagellar hook protein FlgE